MVPLLQRVEHMATAQTNPVQGHPPPPPPSQPVARGMPAQAAAAAKNANGDANGQAAAQKGAEGAIERTVPEPLAKAAMPESDLPKLKAPAANLPVELDVGVPVPEFRVRNLLNLEPGSVIESRWGHADDVPLAAGAVRLAWVEFEVIDNQLAVRVTRLG